MCYDNGPSHVAQKRFRAIKPNKCILVNFHNKRKNHAEIHLCGYSFLCWITVFRCSRLIVLRFVMLHNLLKMLMFGPKIRSGNWKTCIVYKKSHVLWLPFSILKIWIKEIQRIAKSKKNDALETLKQFNRTNNVSLTCSWKIEKDTPRSGEGNIYW